MRLTMGIMIMMLTVNDNGENQGKRPAIKIYWKTWKEIRTTRKRSVSLEILELRL